MKNEIKKVIVKIYNTDEKVLEHNKGILGIVYDNLKTISSFISNHNIKVAVNGFQFQLEFMTSTLSDKVMFSISTYTDHDMSTTTDNTYTNILEFMFNLMQIEELYKILLYGTFCDIRCGLFIPIIKYHLNRFKPIDYDRDYTNHNDVLNISRILIFYRLDSLLTLYYINEYNKYTSPYIENTSLVIRSGPNVSIDYELLKEFELEEDGYVRAEWNMNGLVLLLRLGVKITIYHDDIGDFGLMKIIEEMRECGYIINVIHKDELMEDNLQHTICIDYNDEIFDKYHYSTKRDRDKMLVWTTVFNKIIYEAIYNHCNMKCREYKAPATMDALFNAYGIAGWSTKTAENISTLLSYRSPAIGDGSNFSLHIKYTDMYLIEDILNPIFDFLYQIR